MRWSVLDGDNTLYFPTSLPSVSHSRLKRARVRWPPAKPGLSPRAVEADDGSLLGDADVAVSAVAGVDGLVDGPGFAFVVADFYAEVFAVAILAGLFLAVEAGEVVGIAEEDAVLAAVGGQGIADDAGHADGFEEGAVELWGAPPGCAVFADGDEAAVGFGLAADVEHDAAIGEFDGGRSHWG